MAPREQADELLLVRATMLRRVVVSRDHDFLRLATEWQRSVREFSGVVYGIQERVDVGQAIEYLELTAQMKTADEMPNSVEFIPLR